MTEDIKGESFGHLKDIKDIVKVITDDGMGVSNNRLMFEIMKYAKKNNLIIISHAEDPSFSEFDMRMAENMMTFRNIELAKITGCKLHFAHVSTKEAAQRIIEEKKDYPNITFEVTPHHIFSDDTVRYRVNPPLRKKEDKEYLIKSIRSGCVDCIGTDHAPHTKKDKEKGAPGISGIEIAFQLLYTKLVKENKIPLTRLSELMSKNPGELLGLNKGRLKKGYDGDLVLIEENKEGIINTDNFISKGKNNPFNGEKIFGNIIMTLRKGKIMYQQGEVNDSR
jgi:dihydroorotase